MSNVSFSVLNQLYHTCKINKIVLIWKYMSEYFKYLSPKIRSIIDPKGFYIDGEAKVDVLVEESHASNKEGKTQEKDLKISKQNNDRFDLKANIDYKIVDARNTDHINKSEAKKALLFTKEGVNKIYFRLSQIFDDLDFKNNPKITTEEIVKYILKYHPLRNPPINISFAKPIRTVIMASLKNNPKSISISTTPIMIEYLDLVSKFNLEFFQSFLNSEFCLKNPKGNKKLLQK